MVLAFLATELSAFAETDESIPVTGDAVPGLESLDMMMFSFVREHQVPGASIAVTKDGRLVYARGFGFADREQQLSVQPDSLFRIASISKPVTAAAVLKLVEDGKLALDTKIFPFLGLDKLALADPRLNQITIQHLLNHSGGWDSARTFDPMFRPIEIAKEQRVNPPAKPWDIARYMAVRKLDFDPGSRYVYSNFGYSLLGLAIEKAALCPYDQYVQDAILNPLKIKGMRLGRTLPGDRAEKEVRYYDGQTKPTGKAVVGRPLGRDVPLPYGAWCLESMDSHGGWIASTVDMVRFAAAFDDSKQCPILNPRSVMTMFACPEGTPGHTDAGKPRDAYYACGWMVRPLNGDRSNQWHNGALDGTSTLLVRRWDGLDWAVFFNARKDTKGEELAAAVDALVHQAVDKVKAWPSGGLISKY